MKITHQPAECTAPGCDRKAVAKGLCLMHYKRVRKTGSIAPRVPAKESLITRFQTKYRVDPKTGCWNWTAAISHGYGVININRRAIRAHRVSYELFNGKIPEGSGYHGTCVCHRCDNPSCVNPKHLFLGTVGDNNRDMHAKGRGQRGLPIGYPRSGWNYRHGESHPGSKLTRDDVVCIRQSQDSLSVLAKKYGVSKSHVGRIKRNEWWNWL